METQLSAPYYPATSCMTHLLEPSYPKTTICTEPECTADAPLRVRDAVSTALALPEILEQILSHVDMKTLLISAQRVSKDWAAAINASPVLQKALFFQATPERASRGSGKDAEEPLFLNPLLVKYFSPCFFDPDGTAYYRRANSFMSMPWSPNPRKEEMDEAGYMRSMKLKPREDPYHQPFRERFTRKGASWRRMLVSQPALYTLGHLFTIERLDLRHVFDVSFWHNVDSLSPSMASSGLRMGQLYDFVMQPAFHHRIRHLWFRIHWDIEPPEQFYCQYNETVAADMLQRTKVLVEFLEREYGSPPRVPEDPKGLDLAFRCAEFQQLSVCGVESVPNNAQEWEISDETGGVIDRIAVHEEETSLRD